MGSRIMKQRKNIWDLFLWVCVRWSGCLFVVLGMCFAGGWVHAQSHSEAGFYTLSYPSEFFFSRLEQPQKNMVEASYMHKSGSMMIVHAIKRTASPEEDFQRVVAHYQALYSKSAGNAPATGFYVFNRANVYVMTFGKNQSNKETWVWIVPTHGGNLVLSGTNRPGSPALQLLHRFVFLTVAANQPNSPNLPAIFSTAAAQPSAFPQPSPTPSVPTPQPSPTPPVAFPPTSPTPPSPTPTRAEGTHSHIELGFYTLYYPSSFRAFRQEQPQQNANLSVYTHDSGDVMLAHAIKRSAFPQQDLQRITTYYQGMYSKITGNTPTTAWYNFNNANVLVMMFGKDKFGKDGWVWIVPTYGGHLVISSSTKAGSAVLNVLHGFHFSANFVAQKISPNLPALFPQTFSMDPSVVPKREEGLSHYFCRCMLSQPKSYAREGTYFVCARSAADAAGFSGRKCFPTYQTSCYACVCRGGGRCLFRGR